MVKAIRKVKSNNKTKKIVKKSSIGIKKLVSKAKKVAKKSAVKKARMALKNAPSGQEFFLLNGKKVKNYKELAAIMEDIEDHVFRHHVNGERNDFASWTKDVFKDIQLAKKIAGIRSKDKLELVLYRKIVRGK